MGENKYLFCLSPNQNFEARTKYVSIHLQKLYTIHIFAKTRYKFNIAVVS